MEIRPTAALALFVAASAIANGCGTGAVDIDGCRQIEEARCHQAPACNIPITPPYFTGGSDVDACVRYYDDACLHGLVPAAPSSAQLNACVAAIASDSLGKDCCSTVKAPETDRTDCGWLAPALPDADIAETAACATD
jgi:hypothetical protein